MKKNFLTVLLFVCLCNFISYGQISGEFKISKIDSTFNFYLINVKSRKIKGLILVSKNDTLINKIQSKIQVGKEYKLTLFKNSLTRGIQNTSSPQISVDEKIIWKTGDDFTIYFSDDIENLYYIRKEIQTE